ncbi:MAG: hypothetical protein FWD77_10900 [Betaproteobacteria bacterium]|nr:hypothetical protein [Betaproteobacteria bacterium]
MKTLPFKRALGGATLAIGLSLAAPAWADATFNAADGSLSISSLNIAGMGLFCNVGVRLDGNGQWSLLAAEGPYRGQNLKSSILAAGMTTTMETIAATYTPK